MKLSVLPLMLVGILFSGCNAQSETRESRVVDLTVAEFAERLKTDNVVLLDVRTPGETAGGTIEGAVHLDYRAPDFAERLAELNVDNTFLVYCASGGRSGKTAAMLNDLGAQRVYNLKGGYTAWVAERK